MARAHLLEQQLLKAISANGGSHLRFDIAPKQRVKAFSCLREKAKRFNLKQFQQMVDHICGSTLRQSKELKHFFASAKKQNALMVLWLNQKRHLSYLASICLVVILACVAKADRYLDTVPLPRPLPLLIPEKPFITGAIGRFVEDLVKQVGPLNSKWSNPLGAPQYVEDVLPPDWYWRGGVSILNAEEGTGGLSGLEIERQIDGTLSILAISDSGKWIGGELSQNISDGNYGKLALTRPLDIITKPGARPYQTRNNAEAVSTDKLGNILVAFEGDHRIQRHSTLEDTTPRVLAVPTALQSAFRNTGIEALATLPDGRFFAVAEGLDQQGQLHAWVFSTHSTEWPALLYQKDHYHGYVWKPTAAATMGNKLLIVERWWDQALTFRTRLVSVEIANIKAGTTLRPKILFDLTTLVGMFGNIEGIAVTESATGYLVALVTDNQEFSMLPTMLVILEKHQST